jgi:3-polyprenyl-4-hydroxybenzoate decarboxylase
MKAFKTLRDFLELLESDKQLLRITDAVSLEPDLAAAGRAVNQTGARPARRFCSHRRCFLAVTCPGGG